MIARIPARRLAVQVAQSGEDCRAVTYTVPPRMLRWMHENSTDPYRFEMVNNNLVECGEGAVDIAKTGCRLHASEHDLVLFKIKFGISDA